jgi:hypothetical protein
MYQAAHIKAIVHDHTLVSTETNRMAKVETPLSTNVKF